VTDQIALERILSIFYKDPDIDVERLQPPGDVTDRFKQGDFGGWELVFQYLRSVEFKEAVDFTDFFIIQIDTDVSPLVNFDVPHQEAGRDLEPEELFQRVKQKLISIMDDEFYQTHREKFLFAVCIHSLECWFLPLYYTDNRKSKTSNCLDTLNQKLKAKEGFIIDPDSKTSRLYDKLAQRFKNKKNLIKQAEHNPGFKRFLESLPQ